MLWLADGLPGQGLQVCASMPGFFRWVLGPEHCPSGSNGRTLPFELHPQVPRPQILRPEVLLSQVLMLGFSLLEMYFNVLLPCSNVPVSPEETAAFKL